MINAFRALLSHSLHKTSVFVWIFLFFHTLSAVKPDVSATAGMGWKNDLDPVLAFRSSSDIFKRNRQIGGAILNLSGSVGLSADSGEGFYGEISLGTRLSLQSMENSTLNSAVNFGYLLSKDKVHLFALTGSVHNYTVDFKDSRSLFVDPSIGFSYLYDGNDIFSIFLRTGVTYYFPTHDSVKYMNGLSFFAELGSSIFLHEIFSLDIFAGSSFTFLKDQNIIYNRYENVFYGDLDICGKFFSIYLGASAEVDIKNFFFPVALKYTFSRSFNKDTHRMVYWEDVEMAPTVVKKTRTDNIAEFSVGAGYRFSENYDLSVTYDLYADVSNINGEYGDYADYNRVSHTVIVEFGYAY